MNSMDKREKVSNVYVLRKVKKHKGKIATIILLLLLILPFFTALVLFRPQGILGSFDNKLSLSGPKFNLPEFQTPGFLQDTSTDYGNRNKSLTYLDDNNSNNRKQDQTMDIGESASKELSLGDLKPFNTKLLIRDQKEDAIANTFHRIKSTYDITYGKITTTVFVSRNEPNLPEENAIAISYPIALRLGIIANKPTYVDVVGQLKR
jgi:hypothetical protein